MPTSVPGSSDLPRRAGVGRRARRRSAGLTLIELLVVLVIAGIAVSMVALSVSGITDRSLRSEAERLAQLLSLAHEEATMRGTVIRFTADAAGYRFEVPGDRGWRPIADDDLRARRWSDLTRIDLRRDDGTTGVLEFGRDELAPPVLIRLTRDTSSVTLRGDALGRFDVD